MNIYWESFKTFMKIGAFTLGGGYAMIPIIESEVVDKHQWVTREEFLDLIAIAQSCPGVFAINISVFIGYKLRKVKGALCTALGTALPSFLIILLIGEHHLSQLLDTHSEHHPHLVVGGQPHLRHLRGRPARLPLRQAYLTYGIMIFVKLFITFFQIGLFGFGGGYGMLSLIQTEVVRHHAWISTAEFTNIVAVSQMTPGPIGINSATYCGYTAIHHAGMGEGMAILGSATATFALVLPSFILMVLIAKMFMKYMNTPTVNDIFSVLRPTVVGLLAAATLLLMNEENFSSISTNPWRFWISVGLFIATFIGTKFMKINPIRMIGYAAFAGLVLLY